MPDSRAPLAEPLAQASGIAVAFGGTRVLDGVDVEVRPGEIVSLIGPNGAGKTTLARIVLGLLKPDAGTVRRRARRIGYMPQRLAVDPTLPLSVRRFVGLAGRGDAVGAILAELAIDHVADRPIQAVSGGELQRVLLARALIGDPDLLVLDEPVQGVDVGGQAELFQLIGRLRDRRGCGVLLISHDLHLVMAATDRVICLNHHVCCHGEPAAVRRDPAFVALFGQTVADHVALYHHAHDHRHRADGAVEPVAAAGAHPDRTASQAHPHAHGHRHG